MGSGASSQSPVVKEVVSPRVEMAKGEQQDVVLDSNPLSDVGHGTIHYRYKKPEPSVHDLPGCNKENIPTGYFFHPKLKDYSNMAEAQNEEARKFVRVVEGPTSDKNQHVFYISGIGFDGKHDQVPKTLVASQEKNTKKIFGHKYFAINGVENCVHNKSLDKEGKITAISGTEVEMAFTELSTVKDVKRRLSQHFIVPVGIVHVITSENELDDASLLMDVIAKDLLKSETICVRLLLQ